MGVLILWDSSKLSCAITILPSNAMQRPLYRLPSTKRFWQKYGPLFEKAGRQLPTVLAGGVFLIEVSKRVTPPGGAAVKDKAGAGIRILEGLSNPIPKPV